MYKERKYICSAQEQGVSLDPFGSSEHTGPNLYFVVFSVILYSFGVFVASFIFCMVNPFEFEFPGYLSVV